MARYFFRLDDISPQMDFEKFKRLRKIFSTYDIKPLIAVIPKNHDPKISFSQMSEKDFWSLIRELKNSDWIIALHGFEHLMNTNSGGILKIHKRSEFAGLSLKEQNEKIAEGIKIFHANGFTSEIFVAPAHSFDRNTLKALVSNGINIISDGIALYPFKKFDIIWLPQVTWKPRRFSLGLLTFALHHNTMGDRDILELEDFIKNNSRKIGKFNELILWQRNTASFKRFMAQAANWIFKPLWLVAYRVKHGISK